MEQGWSQNLNDQVKMWPTPTAHLHKETNAPSEANRNEPSLVSIVSGGLKANGSLNPAWVEWLMGYPTGHTDCADWGTPSSRKSRLKSSAPSDLSKNPNPSNQPNENQTKIRIKRRRDT